MQIQVGEFPEITNAARDYYQPEFIYGGLLIFVIKCEMVVGYPISLLHRHLPINTVN